jgi:hypothetical protein
MFFSLGLSSFVEPAFYVSLQVVTYNLPCDPGPNVSVADGCFGNPAKSAEIQRFRDLQLQLLSPPGSGRLL